jgi:hypothetical protein
MQDAEDLLKHCFGFPKHLMVGESQDADAARVQPGGSQIVAFLLLRFKMMTAIDFDCE